MQERIVLRIKKIAAKSLFPEFFAVAFVVLCLNHIFVTRYALEIPFRHWIIAFCNVAFVFSLLALIRSNERRYKAYVVFVFFCLSLFMVDSALYYFKNDVTSVAMLFEGLKTNMGVAARYNPLVPYGLFTWLLIVTLIVGGLMLLKRLVHLHCEPKKSKAVLYCGIALAGVIASPLALSERDALAFSTPADRGLFVKRFGPLTYHARDLVSFARHRVEPVFMADAYMEAVQGILQYGEGMAPESAHFGRLAGQNVIMIMCETCEQYAFDRDLTPNYYWLRDHGHYYENFYSATRSSTYDAEFKSLTSSMYLSQSDNYYYRWDENSFATTLPNVLLQNGYTTRSFHNWQGAFFNRINIHPRLGFEQFYPLESLQDLDPSHFFPLDSAMFEQMHALMAPIQEQPFFSFVITITPHGPHDYRAELEAYYQLIDEHPLYRDREIEFKTLMAAQMDFDRGLGILLDSLRENGLLENTMIVLFGDHRNYSSGHITERYTPDAEVPYETDKVPMVIYSGRLGSSSEETLSSHYDVAPTILDLLGIGYHSGLYYGQSLFLEDREDRPIIISHSNWISREMVVVDDEVVAGKVDEERFLEVRLWIWDVIDFYDKLFVLDFFSGRNEDLLYDFGTPLHSQAVQEPAGK